MTSEHKYRVGFCTLGCKLNFSESSTIARAFEQEGYTLDVAGGNASESVNSPNAYQYPTDYDSFYDQLAEDFRQHSLKQKSD